MLVHPWDAAIDDDEWRAWIADGHDFGQLIAAGAVGPVGDASVEGGGWPIVVPTHFVLAGDTVLLHLARPNPVWKAIEGNATVVLGVVSDYTFVPGYWRTASGLPSEYGVPTTYYGAVQLHCHAEIVDDPEQKALILQAQLAHSQPEGQHAPAEVGAEPYGRMLSGIRGLRLQIVHVRAKFKYDDHKPLELREGVSAHLAERDTGLDEGARAEQQRRIAALGERYLPG